MEAASTSAASVVITETTTIEIVSSSTTKMSNRNHNESKEGVSPLSSNGRNSTSSPGPSRPKLIVDFSDFTVPVPSSPRSLQPDELRRHFLISLEKMFTLEPESLPFRQPVDTEALGIPDYFDIIRKAMDLHTIRIKMNCLKYTDPWMYIDDVLLMFDNAWVYNRPACRVYRYCTKLAEVFQQEINPVMQRLGYRHGRIHQFNSQILSCFGRPVCLIQRNATYYNFLRFHLCENCYSENLEGEGVKLPWQNNVTVNKENFIQLTNDSENAYSPAAEMHRSHMRDAEMSRQLVIREFLRLLYCSTTSPERKQSIIKMLKLNAQLRSEFLKYFKQQEVALSNSELEAVRQQLELIELDNLENLNINNGNNSGGSNSPIGETNTTSTSPNPMPRLTSTSNSISTSLSSMMSTPTSTNDNSPSSSKSSTLSSLN